MSFTFPNEYHGMSYELNWSLAKTGVVPQGLSFRNLKAAELSQAGGSIKTDAPKVVDFENAIEREVKAQLGGEKVTRYVQDCALGALASNEIHARIVSDSSAAALAFHTLCSRTKKVPLPEYEADVEVLHVTSLGSRGSFITMNPKTKQIFMAGSFNAGAVVKMIASMSTDFFLHKGTLPLWGPGKAGETVFCSLGFDAGSMPVKHGFAISTAGFCRLFMGSVR